MPTRIELLVGWFVLLVVALGLLAGVAAVVWWHRRRERIARQQQAAIAAQQAAVVAARTGRCADALARARQRVQEAEPAQASAWDELVRAQRAHHRAAQEHLAAVRQRAGRLDDAPDGREVIHAAYAAYRRGDLTSAQLLAVSQVATGWDEALTRQEREVTRLRVARRDAQTRYRAAASRYRAAREELQVIEVEARALAEEGAELLDEAATAAGAQMDAPAVSPDPRMAR